MPEVILFHSVLGLRPDVAALAGRLTAMGHPTCAPDLYSGRATADVEEGFALFNEVGRDRIPARAREAMSGLTVEAVLAGISAGAGVAGAI